MTFLEDRGLDNDTVIACAPVDPPEDYATRTN
ncbi:hypothetical protein ACFYV7_36495 [Nocardia suismassiliense]|uniref:Uncharacterized protein n=1 Tax=Nocardia suismassiliense TaxID=2077092 RepID=A0ABW6R507_9NOCA